MRYLIALVFVALVYLVMFPKTVLAATYTVTKTADTNDGTCDADCSLREAITAANAAGGADTINFNIPTSDAGYINPDGSRTSTGEPAGTYSVTANGYYTISASSIFPTIIESLHIDGKTQAGYVSKPVIEITGGVSGAGSILISGSNITIESLDFNSISSNSYGVIGMIYTPNDSTFNTIKDNFFGVDVNGDKAKPVTGAGGVIGILGSGSINNVIQNNLIACYQTSGIVVNLGNNNTIVGNKIGVKYDGLSTFSTCTTSSIGIYIWNNVSGNIVGGSNASDRNIIAVPQGTGIQIQQATSTNIINNYIGVGADGVTPLGSGLYGMQIIINSNNNLIDNNVVGAQLVDGILVRKGSTSNTISNNKVGVGADGTTNIHNSMYGIYLWDYGPLNNIFTGNIVRNNLRGGIAMNRNCGTQCDSTFRDNIVYGNGVLDINLNVNNTSLTNDDNTDGVTLNDSGDTDTGTNNLMNFPVINSAQDIGAGKFRIKGTVDYKPSEGPITIEIFKSDNNASGYGGSILYLGSVTSNTDGVWSLDVLVPGNTWSDKMWFTTTATNVLGDTSEFSQNYGIGGSEPQPSYSTCQEKGPTSPPLLYKAISPSSTSVLLYFYPPQGDYTNYMLEYGTASNKYTYGNSNIGSKPMSTYLVTGLSPGIKYYFRVGAKNGCAAGGWSNEWTGVTDGSSVPTLPASGNTVPTWILLSLGTILLGIAFYVEKTSFN